MLETIEGKSAGLGDAVYLIDKKTQLPASPEFIVLGIAHRPGPNNLMRKYLYLSDGNGAYDSEDVRVVTQLSETQEKDDE